MAIYAALCEVAARTSEPAPPALLTRVLACLAQRTSPETDQRPAFFRALPLVIQRQVWVRARDQGQPPARVPVDQRGAWDPADLRFTLEVLNPRGWELFQQECLHTATHIVQLLQATCGTFHDASVQESATLTARLNLLQARLNTLLDMVGDLTIDDKFLETLAAAFATDLVPPSAAHISGHVSGLRAVVAACLFSRTPAPCWPPFVAHVLARLIATLESSAEESVIPALLHTLGPGEGVQRQRTLYLLETLARYYPSSQRQRVGEQIAVQREFIGALQDEFSTRRTPAGPQITLPAYEAWLKPGAQQSRSFLRGNSAYTLQLSREYRSFHAQLRTTLAELPIGAFLPVAASYLCLNPYVQDDLLSVVLTQLQSSAHQVQWLLFHEQEERRRRAYWQPARFFADIVKFTFERAAEVHKAHAEECLWALVWGLSLAYRKALLDSLKPHLGTTSWWRHFERTVRNAR